MIRFFEKSKTLEGDVSSYLLDIHPTQSGYLRNDFLIIFIFYPPIKPTWLYFAVKGSHLIKP